MLLPEKRECWYGAFDRKSDVWSLGYMLMDMMGITPSMMCFPNTIDDLIRNCTNLFEGYESEREECIDFLKKCVDEGWSVNELMQVSDWERE